MVILLFLNSFIRASNRPWYLFFRRVKNCSRVSPNWTLLIDNGGKASKREKGKMEHLVRTEARELEGRGSLQDFEEGRRVAGF